MQIPAMWGEKMYWGTVNHHHSDESENQTTEFSTVKAGIWEPKAQREGKVGKHKTLRGNLSVQLAEHNFVSIWQWYKQK